MHHGVLAALRSKTIFHDHCLVILGNWDVFQRGRFTSWTPHGRKRGSEEFLGETCFKWDLFFPLTFGKNSRSVLPFRESCSSSFFQEIPPFETKPVMRANFIGRAEMNHTAFIRIRTNRDQNEILVLPVEVEVTSCTCIINYFFVWHLIVGLELLSSILYFDVWEIFVSWCKMKNFNCSKAEVSRFEIEKQQMSVDFWTISFPSLQHRVSFLLWRC